MNRVAWLTTIVFACAQGSAFADNKDKVWPCESETASLMTLETAWPDLYLAASALPSKCFDGYFAEGISDTLVRKMGRDWPGFTNLLRKHKNDKKFFGLILRSINATLNPDDIDVIESLSKGSCPSTLRKQCDAIETQIGVARKDLGT